MYLKWLIQIGIRKSLLNPLWEGAGEMNYQLRALAVSSEDLV